MTRQKTAIVLFNLGGPSGEETIRPFLKNFFMDKNIITAPWPVRFLVSRLIAWRRGGGAARESYAHLGGKSPLLENTRAQAQALQSLLEKNAADGHKYRVFVCMRYWHPMAAEVVAEVKDFAPDDIVLLPLYPQFSTTTSFSSQQTWEREAAKQGLTAPVNAVCCYPFAQGFIDASVQRIRAALEKAPPGTRLLFSAHGLPKKVIDKGDPYQYQCEKGAEEIARTLNMPGLDWEICYQSRVGPLEWIGPSTEEALEKAARDGKGVVVYPHAFVSEHVETLVEIGIEYREKAHELGLPYFEPVETVGTHPDFIACLAAEVAQARTSEKRQRLCPAVCTRCPTPA